MLPFCIVQKLAIFFRTAKSTVGLILNFSKFPWHGFCKAADVMLKSEVEVKINTKMEEIASLITLNEWYVQQLFLFWLTSR